MDRHADSAFERLEIVETGRRRRWSEAAKERIVLESLSGPRLITATARRHKISRSQVLIWRRAFLARSGGGVAGFVPAVVTPQGGDVLAHQCPGIHRCAGSGARGDRSARRAADLHRRRAMRTRC
jgi:transposase